MRRDIEPPLDPPDEVIIGECKSCEEEVLQGADIIVLIEGGIVHDDCFVTYAKEELMARRVLGASKEDVEGA